jgi:hypothetical protein
VLTFGELLWGLGWQPRTLLAMLWHYLDESGEHSPQGSLIRLTLGGGIASAEQWGQLEGPWKEALAEAGVSTFHMADFEAWAPPFDFRLSDGSRDREKHNRLLNALLDTIIAHIDQLVGFVGAESCGKPEFEDAYAANVAKAVKHGLIDAYQSGEPIRMVFAKHRDFKGARIAKFFEQWDEPGRLEFGGIAEPCDLPQLQVADIVAYEMSRWFRDQRPDEDRYPLRRLKEGLASKPNARFLLTFVP